MVHSDDLIVAFDEDGCPHYFKREVHDALRAVGLMRPQPDGRVTFQAEDIDMRLFPELAVCDFCLERPVTWDIEAESFHSPMMNYTSLEGWCACEACGAFVQAGDRQGLQDRVLAAVRSPTDSSRAHHAQGLMLREMLRGFWSHFKSIHRHATTYAAAPDGESTS